MDTYKDRERTAHELLTLKNLHLKSSQRQALNRTALAALKKLSSGGKQWISIGGTFIKCTPERASEIILQDLRVVEAELYELGVKMKELAVDVVEYGTSQEKKDVAKAAVELKPITSKDLYNIVQQ